MSYLKKNLFAWEYINYKKVYIELKRSKGPALRSSCSIQAPYWVFHSERQGIIRFSRPGKTQSQKECDPSEMDNNHLKWLVR